MLGNMNLYDTELFSLKKPNDIASDADLKKYNNEQNLCLDNMESILFFIPKNEIPNFQFNDNTEIIIHKTENHIEDIPSTNMFLNEKISYHISNRNEENFSLMEITTNYNYIVPEIEEEKIKELNIPIVNITKEKILENKIKLWKMLK